MPHTVIDRLTISLQVLRILAKYAIPEEQAVFAAELERLEARWRALVTER